MKLGCISISFLICICALSGQENSFHFGGDLSYINEMESCGVIYTEDNQVKEPFQIFADNGGTLARFRLWHHPSWYSNLNNGILFGDLPDTKNSIRRAKEANLQILLNFQLSDNWADPSNQLVPKAWENIVDNTTLLGDSLYNYIYQTLNELHQENLLPEYVQIGNETNKGILLSKEENQDWVLDWSRNAFLFNKAISAVRAFELTANTTVKIALHFADPANVKWLLEGFFNSGVMDFDIIGISYYWEWHHETTLNGVGDLINQLNSTYSDKEVMVLETGFPWDNTSVDQANNILNLLPREYNSYSPINQRNWLVDLGKTIQNNGGTGMIYWEPFWVSSSCDTQWGQGSHYENATFFDHNNNLIKPGGIQWMQALQPTSTAFENPTDNQQIYSYINSNKCSLTIEVEEGFKGRFIISNELGQVIQAGMINKPKTTLLNSLEGMMVLQIYNQSGLKYIRKHLCTN